MAVPQSTGYQINNVQGDRAALLAALHRLDPQGWTIMARAVFDLARSGQRLLDTESWACVRLACDDIFPGERGQG